MIGVVAADQRARQGQFHRIVAAIGAFANRFQAFTGIG